MSLERKYGNFDLRTIKKKSRDFGPFQGLFHLSFLIGFLFAPQKFRKGFLAFQQIWGSLSYKMVSYIKITFLNSMKGQKLYYPASNHKKRFLFVWTFKNISRLKSWWTKNHFEVGLKNIDSYKKKTNNV